MTIPLRYEAVYAGFIAAEKEKEQWKEVAHSWAEEAGKLQMKIKKLEKELATLKAKL